MDERPEFPRRGKRHPVATGKHEQAVAHAVRQDDAAVLHTGAFDENFIAANIVVVSQGWRGTHPPGGDLQWRVVAEVIENVADRVTLAHEMRRAGE